MEYRTQVVPAKDLALLQAAIGLGGTITHSKPHDNGDVAVTYVVDDPSQSTAAGRIPVHVQDQGWAECG